MCGLVGVAGSMNDNDQKAFHHLLWIDAIRGGDGTGMFAVDRNVKETFLVKTSGGPEHLFDRMQYRKALDQQRILMMGHNRARTVGSDSWDNAHPFSFSHVTGAHNGTLHPFSHKKIPDQEFFDTDSEAVFNSINENGIEATVKLMSGAWALAWWDNRDNTLNFLRNKERTLFYAFDESHTTMYWASEVAMLYLALNHNHIKFSAKDVHVFAEDIHYKFAVPLKRAQVFPKPVKVERKGFFPAPQKQDRGGSSRHGEFDRMFPRQTPSELITARLNGQTPLLDHPVVITPNTPLKPNEVASRAIAGGHPPIKLSRLIVPNKQFKARSYYLGFTAQDVLYKEEWEKHVGQGCANCMTVPQWGEPFKPLRDGTFLCSECIINNPDDILLACGGLL